MTTSNETLIVDASELNTVNGINKVLDTLMYGSYKANREYGVSHEQLVKHGIGNDEMKKRYEQETNSKPSIQ